MSKEINEESHNPLAVNLSNSIDADWGIINMEGENHTSLNRDKEADIEDLDFRFIDR
jgi:hypothetical protein